ncbi:DHS-like NAD/FAD-binding domain-containing protein [Auricularia subglabra TFB-10046 SS5]|nr:DHS-like NAD/FAD-binding domain-containing protein [Auricularia subglabra TFB-10046 SS5]
MLVTYELAVLAHDEPTRQAFMDTVTQLHASKRVVVVTGAGISCSAGIPDFRSSSGLYGLVQQHGRTLQRGTNMFDAAVLLRADLAADFLSLIAQLKTLIDRTKPSAAHYFIEWLRQQEQLLRGYTQNFDGLETHTGLRCSTSTPWGIPHTEIDIVQLHGSIHSVYCALCSASYPCSQSIIDSFREGQAPECPQCITRRMDRIERRARPTRIGALRPAIILNNEAHPGADDIAATWTTDLSRDPDLLLIMGTSLKSHGVKQLVKSFAKAVRSTATAGPRVIFVNNTAPSAEWKSIIDVHFSADIDEWVEMVLATSKSSFGE